MTAQRQDPVHYLDPGTGRPACGSSVPFAWHWTERPPRVTCARCRAVLSGTEAPADPEDLPGR